MAPFYPSEELDEIFLEGGSPGLRKELEECYAQLGIETTTKKTTTDETFDLLEADLLEAELLDENEVDEVGAVDDADKPDKVNLALN